MPVDHRATCGAAAAAHWHRGLCLASLMLLLLLLLLGQTGADRLLLLVAWKEKSLVFKFTIAAAAVEVQRVSLHGGPLLLLMLMLMLLFIHVL